MPRRSRSKPQIVGRNHRPMMVVDRRELRLGTYDSREAIALLWNSFNQCRPTGSERLAQSGNVDGEVGLLNKCIRPKRVEYPVFLEQASRVLNHQYKQVEYLWSHQHRLITGPKEPFSRVQTELPELKDPLCFVGHEAFGILLETSWRLLSTERQLIPYSYTRDRTTPYDSGRGGRDDDETG